MGKDMQNKYEEHEKQDRCHLASADSYRSQYQSLESAITLIDEPNRSCCHAFLEENRVLLETARGSQANHQAWPGGYKEHIAEVMNIAMTFYEPLNARRKLPFSISDALLVLFLHDLEKPWKYMQDYDADDSRPVIKEEMKDKQYIHDFVKKKIKEYRFVLSDEHWNALDYAEGETGVWTPGHRSMGRLAAFVHMCDVWSARGWHDFPKKKEQW